MKQLCNVVMLPTNNKANAIWWSGHKLYFKSPEDPSRGELNHLYITSSEESKEGDWFIADNQYLIKCNGQTSKSFINGNFYRSKCKKIIATTDRSLIWSKETEALPSLPNQFPQIPESFIKKFIESNGSITEVLVDFVDIGSIINDGFGGVKHISDIQPKLREDNTIIISPSKTYTYEDLVKVFNYAQEQTEDFCDKSFTFDHDINDLPSFVEKFL